MQMPGKTGQTRASHKTSDGDFIHADDGKTAQRHPQRSGETAPRPAGGGKQKNSSGMPPTLTPLPANADMGSAGPPNRAMREE